MTKKVTTITERWNRVLAEAVPKLRAIDEKRAAKKPRPGKWSSKEILGHLVDSASNNHRRFIVGQFKDDLVFAGYDQDKWVAAQRYQDREWEGLIDLWERYNQHLLHLVISTDPNSLTVLTTRHNFNKITMRPVSPYQAVCLLDLIDDYVHHLEHHLGQIYALAGNDGT
jgi:hypothetical protein